MRNGILLLLSILTASARAHEYSGPPEWLKSPRIQIESSLRSDLNACLTGEVQRQGGVAASEELFFLAPLIKEDPTTKRIVGLEFGYCTVNEQGYSKECGHFILMTSDPDGWQTDLTNNGQFASARDFGRYVEVINPRTQQKRYNLDLAPCAAFFEGE